MSSVHTAKFIFSQVSKFYSERKILIVKINTTASQWTLNTLHPRTLIILDKAHTLCIALCQQYLQLLNSARGLTSLIEELQRPLKKGDPQWSNFLYNQQNNNIVDVLGTPCDLGGPSGHLNSLQTSLYELNKSGEVVKL